MKKRWIQWVARLQELVENVEGFLQRATPRRRVMLVGMSAGVTLGLVLLVTLDFAHAIHRRELAIAARASRSRRLRNWRRLILSAAGPVSSWSSA